MLKASFLHRKLNFKKPVGTSRGILHDKDSWFIFLNDDGTPEVIGTGECSVIPNLSVDALPDLEERIKKTCQKINSGVKIENLELTGYPAIKFAFETALMDLKNKGNKILFPSAFTEGKDSIAINGLIWMGDIETMMRQLKEKIELGFRCIKIKVGAVSFQEEIKLLKQIRKDYSKNEVTIRLDANGAFHPDDTIEILERLSKYDIHSIEQPIKQGNITAISALCRNTPIPIALDEELIGISQQREKKDLLETIKPQYIILKPSLLGGFTSCEEWIDLAEQMNIDWWITSALESNIGLNAIAQWTFQLNKNIYHGLGTGQIYTNNIRSPLHLEGENLIYNPDNNWGKIFKT